MSEQLKIFDRLLEIALLLQDDLARSLGDSGLTVARTHLLWELHQLGPSTQQRLATALKVSPRNVTGLVDALEAGDFVIRGPHPTDRRATLVRLTELGARTMAAMERGREQLAAELVSDLDEQSLERLRLGLDAVAARLRGLVAAAKRSEGQDRP